MNSARRPSRFNYTLMLGMAVLLLAGAAAALPLRDAALLNRAQLLQVRGYSDDAQHALLALLESRPTAVLLRWQTGLTLLRGRRLEDAAAVLDPVLLPAHDAAIVNTQVTALLATSRWQPAVELAQTRGLMPEEMPVHVAAGLAYAQLSGEATGFAAPTLHNLLARALDITPDSSRLELLAERLATDAAVREHLLAVLRLKSDSWQTLEWETEAPAESSPAAPLPAGLPIASLGPELLSNGGFEHLERAFGIPFALEWEPRNTWNTTIWEPSVFTQLIVPQSEIGAGGTPNASGAGRQVLRLDGVVVGEPQGFAKPSGGMQHPPVPVEVGHPYVLTLRYRTSEAGEGEGISLWISPVGNFFGERHLPLTGGEWKQAALLFRSQDVTLAPWVRLWTEGSAWVDDLSLRAVTLTEESSLGSEVVIVPGLSTLSR